MMMKKWLLLGVMCGALVLSGCGVSVTNDTVDTVNYTWPYTAEVVSMHDTSRSCWTIVDGKVYDMTAFIEQHPGGAEAIMRMCGKDGTQGLLRKHGTGQTYMDILAEGYLWDLVE